MAKASVRVKSLSLLGCSSPPLLLGHTAVLVSNEELLLTALPELGGVLV